MASKPDAMLVSGDLISNGEFVNAQRFATRLKEAKGQLSEGAGIYVVNGNHDMNMSYAAKFTDAGVEAAQRIEQADFRSLFDGLGYNGGEGFSYFADAAPEAAEANGEVRNSGGLSYSTHIAEGITLISLDTAMYANDEQAQFNQAQRTAGSVSSELLAWAAQQARNAKANGDLVLVMTHHAMLPHYSERNETSDSYMRQMVITNWQEVADTLADAGVTAYLTGHTHSDDIVKYVTPSGNTIYDINTAGLCAYPCAWRTVEITINGSGADATYGFDIDTNHIEHVDGIDDLQAHAYEKTGFTEQNIEPVLDYLIRQQMYDIKSFSDESYGSGTSGFLCKTLDLHLEPGDTLGKYVTSQLANQAQSIDVSESLTAFGMEINISAKFERYDEQSDILYVRATLSADGDTESGTFAIDLSSLPQAIDDIVARFDEDIERTGDSGVYTPSALQADLNKLATTIVLGATKDPLDPSDSNSSVLGILNEAYQANMHGDEQSFVWKGLGIGTADELQSKRASWQALLLSDTFATKATDEIWDAAKNIDSRLYPTIASILEGTRLSSTEDGMISYTKDPECEEGLLSALAYMDPVNTVYDLLVLTSILPVNPIPTGFVQTNVSQPLVNMHVSFTTDSNIPDDTRWRFHSVLFDANGGQVSPTSDLTVENGLLGRRSIGLELPIPTREDYVFEGWFTSAEGGDAVTTDADFSNIDRIYAHWSFAGTYTCVEGDGAEWTLGSSEPLEFTFRRSVEDETTLSHFTGILVDGQAVSDQDFEVRPESGVWGLKPTYLQTLSEGEHSLTAQFDDADDVTVTFVVAQRQSEETGTDPDPSDDAGEDNDKPGDDTGEDDGGDKPSSGTDEDGSDKPGDETDSGSNGNGGGSGTDSGNGSPAGSGANANGTATRSVNNVVSTTGGTTTIPSTSSTTTTSRAATARTADASLSPALLFIAAAASLSLAALRKR